MPEQEIISKINEAKRGFMQDPSYLVDVVKAAQAYRKRTERNTTSKKN